MKHLYVSVIVLCAFWSQAAHAEQAATKLVSVEFSIDLASDYRFRGVSLSDQKPVVQASLSIEHESGLYAGLDASNIAANPGLNAEFDASVGYRGALAGIDYDVSALYYTYPGFSQANTLEFSVSLSRDLGIAVLGATVAWMPPQRGTGHAANHYVGLIAAIPVSDRLGLNFAAGLEDGAFADRKIDWSAGLDLDLGNGFSGSFAYIDTAHSLLLQGGGATVLARVGRSF